MMNQLEEILRFHGVDPDSIPEDKSPFQQNEEMASILLTFLMTENDFLRMRIEVLEARVTELEAKA